ncbi:hypothetical protein CWATWH0005_1712 [Crocosphaera watsonii WH 0005]|uniref:Uncharacterized protein n=1 Tax=Crocosphaera watsonii WH 0005 TaxID=423472 RepID=T2ISB9_CROWT|nr:hypothetical protein CWATWH0005_1712 [Crocosphaera watsonii WH 0005]
MNEKAKSFCRKTGRVGQPQTLAEMPKRLESEPQKGCLDSK